MESSIYFQVKREKTSAGILLFRSILLFSLLILLSIQYAYTQESSLESIPPVKLSGMIKNGGTEFILMNNNDPLILYKEEISSLFAGLKSDSLKDRGNVWKSFLIPGWGEYALNHKKRARFFFTTEVTLFVVRAIFKAYEKNRRLDYKNFAATHAGINPAGKNYIFFVDIGNYLSIYEYNSSQLRYRAPDNLYHIETGYYWFWDSDKNRHKFREMRIDADRARVYATFTTGFIVLNHLISLFDSLYLYRSKYGIVEITTRNGIGVEYSLNLN